MSGLQLAKGLLASLASMVGIDPTLATLLVEVLQASRLCVNDSRLVIQGEYLEGELSIKDPILARKLRAVLGGCER